MALEDYDHPALTTDVVLLSVGAGQLNVLLIQRGKSPFQGAWAFPGGFVDIGESPFEAAARELEEETNIRDVPLEQLRAFGDPERDPRGHTVTIAYLAVVTAREVRHVEAGSDAAQLRWWSVKDLPPLAFDHAEILDSALQRLHCKLRCALPEVGPALALPEELTLGELNAAQRAITERLGRDAHRG